MIARPALALALPALLAFGQEPMRDDPRAVVRLALRAVEGDSVAAVRARWEERVRRDPRDRAAALGLATVARFTYDYADAERRYGALAPASGAAPDPYSTYAQLGRGWAANEYKLDDAAVAAFTEALRQGRARGDGAAQAEALVGLSLLRAAVQGVPVGFATLDSAKRRIPADAPELLAEWHIRRGVLNAVSLAAAAADSDVAAALAAARQAGEPRLEARALRTAGHAMLLRGEADSAAATFRRVEEMQRRAGDRSALSETFLRHVTAASEKGDPVEMKRLLDAAMTEAEASRNLFAIDGAYVGLGALSMQVHDYASAGEYLAHAEKNYRSRGSVPDVMTVKGFQGNLALATGDLPLARALSQERLEFARQVGDPSEEFMQYRQLAWVALHEGDTTSARRLVNDAITLARRHGAPRWIESLTIERGRLALARRDFPTAERYFRTYVEGADSAGHLQRHLGRAQLAETYARQGDLARAEEELTAAGDDLDRWRASLTDRELRTLSFQTDPREHSDRGAATATVLAALATGGRAEAAFALTERHRARDLADRMVQTVALASRRSDAAEAAAGYLRRRVGVADVAAALPDRTALLEYATGPSGAPTTLLAVTRGPAGSAQVRGWVLPPADSLAPLVERFGALLESGGDPRTLARQLGAAFLDSVAAAVGPGVTRLIIVPDGPLHRLPFDALRLAGGQYAVERFAIGLAPSAAVVLAQWRRERGEGAAVDRRPVRILAFGDPTFAGDDGASAPGTEASAFRSAFAAAGGLPRLAASGTEAREVARYASDAVVRLRESATESYLKSAPLGDFRVIHFATHALVDDRSAARTALALAPGSGETGFVGPGDLAALHLNADLVVLSACRSAGGVVVDGEGVQGLTAPLLQAGARSVVATRWRIGDQTTVALVDAFYAGLARGLPAGEALQAAKLDAMLRGAPPGDWAAFTVIGDPLVTVPLRQPGTDRPWWLVALASAAAVGGVAAALRRRRSK